jgi:hypothetical protein
MLSKEVVNAVADGSSCGFVDLPGLCSSYDESEPISEMGAPVR